MKDPLTPVEQGPMAKYNPRPGNMEISKIKNN